MSDSTPDSSDELDQADLEPAEHTDPDGPGKGWSAAEMADVPRCSDQEISDSTVLVADGGVADHEAEDD